MIEVKINNQDAVIALLEKLADGLTHRQGLMNTLAGTLLYAVDRNFEEGGRPKWLGHKYPKEGAKVLIKDGLLRKSILQSKYSDNDVARVGSNLEYAAIHQFGGKAGRNRSVTIPARPFLQLTEQDEGDLVDDVQTYLQNLIA